MFGQFDFVHRLFPFLFLLHYCASRALPFTNLFTSIFTAIFQYIGHCYNLQQHLGSFYQVALFFYSSTSFVLLLVVRFYISLILIFNLVLLQSTVYLTFTRPLVQSFKWFSFSFSYSFSFSFLFYRFLHHQCLHITVPDIPPASNVCSLVYRIATPLIAWS